MDTRYGAQMRWTHFRCPESLDRLWLLWALSSPAWTVSGLLAFAENRIVVPFSRKKGPRLSLFSVETQHPKLSERGLRLPRRLLLLLLPRPFLRNIQPRGGER